MNQKCFLKNDLELRFLKKVIKGNCWIWSAAKDQNGYGVMWNPITRKRERATRISVSLFTGQKLNSKMLVCHHCDNPSCVRPDHLFVGTHKDNTTDMMNKGRYVNGKKYRGSEHGCAKLTESKVIEIRSKYSKGNHTYEDLGKEFKIHKTVIGKIIRNQLWKK